MDAKITRIEALYQWNSDQWLKAFRDGESLKMHEVSSKFVVTTYDGNDKPIETFDIATREALDAYVQSVFPDNP